MTIRDELEPRPVRRLGSGVVHFAAYGDELRQPATHFGAPFMHVGAPLVALCGVVLRGDITEMTIRTLIQLRHGADPGREMRNETSR